ncbi:MAG: hypothetical protein ACXABO_14385 [Promethearchaeota archaeon]
MKIKRKRAYILVIIIVIIIIAGLIIPLSLIINNSIILTRIYYDINYKGSVQNLETIIEKSELFEYEKYCKYRDYEGVVHNNISDVDYLYHIDRDFIESLKPQIDEDKKKFHLYTGFQHNFIYSVEVTNESLIYLTYNNNAIIKAEYANQTEIFAAKRGIENGVRFWLGNWYLNFTQIPFAPSSSSTIKLNNTILVRMYLEYRYSYSWGGSGDIRIEQFLCFNSEVQTMFVYFPLTYLSVT